MTLVQTTFKKLSLFYNISCSFSPSVFSRRTFKKNKNHHRWFLCYTINLLSYFERYYTICLSLSGRRWFDAHNLIWKNFYSRKAQICLEASSGSTESSFLNHRHLLKDGPQLRDEFLRNIVPVGRMKRQLWDEFYIGISRRSL